MTDLLQEYLKDPTPEKFLALRAAVMATEGFNPYSRSLDPIPDLMQAQNYERVVELTSQHLWPNHFLNPGHHMRLAFALHHLGREEESRYAGSVATLLFQGLESTGDGSRENPFLVSCIPDEYDYLSMHELTLDQQDLVEDGSRRFDVMTTPERGDIYFDITEIQEILDEDLENEPDCGPGLN